MFKAQKGSKDIVKSTCDTSDSTNVMKLWGKKKKKSRKENNINDFIQLFLLFRVSLRHVFTRVPLKVVIFAHKKKIS